MATSFVGCYIIWALLDISSNILVTLSSSLVIMRASWTKPGRCKIGSKNGMFGKWVWEMMCPWQFTFYPKNVMLANKKYQKMRVCRPKSQRWCTQPWPNPFLTKVVRPSHPKTMSRIGHKIENHSGDNLIFLGIAHLVQVLDDFRIFSCNQTWQSEIVNLAGWFWHWRNFQCRRDFPAGNVWLPEDKSPSNPHFQLFLHDSPMKYPQNISIFRTSVKHRSQVTFRFEVSARGAVDESILPPDGRGCLVLGSKDSLPPSAELVESRLDSSKPETSKIQISCCPQTDSRWLKFETRQHTLYIYTHCTLDIVMFCYFESLLYVLPSHPNFDGLMWPLLWGLEPATRPTV